MDLNKIILIGNLTRDPAERKLTSGQLCATFGLATNLRWRDGKTKELREAAEFHRVVTWGNLAELAVQYLEKGSRVYIEGRLRQRSYSDKQGQKHSIQEVSVSELILLSGYKRNADNAASAEINEEDADEIIEEEAS